MSCFFFFFFNDTATTEIYTLSLHDALPIFRCARTSWSKGIRMRRNFVLNGFGSIGCVEAGPFREIQRDRKSTRLNSSHGYISYAVFCLKKKKKCRTAKVTTRNKQAENLRRA